VKQIIRKLFSGFFLLGIFLTLPQLVHAEQINLEEKSKAECAFSGIISKDPMGCQKVLDQCRLDYKTFLLGYCSPVLQQGQLIPSEFECGDWALGSAHNLAQNWSDDIKSTCEYAINPIPECGNGITNGWVGETCDDHNYKSGDGCSDTCKVESGWTCKPGWGGSSACERLLQLAPLPADYVEANLQNVPPFQANIPGNINGPTGQVDNPQPYSPSGGGCSLQSFTTGTSWKTFIFFATGLFPLFLRRIIKK